MGSIVNARRGSSEANGPGDSVGFPRIDPTLAAPGRLPLNSPCSMSSHDHAYPPMSYLYLLKNVSLSRKPPLGGPTTQVTWTIIALYTLTKNAIFSSLVSERKSTV